jgi:hypothetical protein
MKWIGQHIYDLVARFRNDVYLEDLSTTTETNVLVVDSDGKVSKTTVITGDVTGITAGSNITVTDPTGPVPTVALSTNVDVAGTLDVTSLGTFDASVTVAGDVGIGTASPASSAKLTVMGNQTFGLPGSGSNTNGRFISIEGNADSIGEGSGRIFFTEHNSTTGSMDSYGMSLGYRGGSTSIVGSSGNTWTGLTQIGNGEWGMFGHDNNSTGVKIMQGSRSGTYTAFHSSGSETMRVTGGKVGIGTTSPAQKLDVVGSIAISENIELGHASDTTITRVSAGIIAVEGVNVVTRSSTDTLTNKTLTLPIIEGAGVTFAGSTSGATKLVATAVAGSTVLTLPAATDTLVGRATTDILTNKTLTTPRISSIFNTGTLTLPAATDTLVGRATTDTLTNKTLTAPTITGAGAIAGVFTGNITGNVTGNADTVTTNADLTGPVTSTGNTTAIADGAITTAMQKHLQTFEFNGYLTAAASTNYFIPAAISTNTGPFNHNVSAGASGKTALAPQNLLRTGGKVMPYNGTCKLWKGWVSASSSGAVNISIFKFTPVAGVSSNVALVLVKNFSTAALGNANLIAIDLTTGFVSLSAGDILITGISCVSGQEVFFTSTLEVEWD